MYYCVLIFTFFLFFKWMINVFWTWMSSHGSLNIYGFKSFPVPTFKNWSLNFLLKIDFCSWFYNLTWFQCAKTWKCFSNFFVSDAVKEIYLCLYTLWFATGRLRDCETNCALLCMFENSRVNMKNTEFATAEHLMYVMTSESFSLINM